MTSQLQYRAQFRAGQPGMFEEKAAAARPLSSGDKSEDVARVALLAEQIGALQDVFYANSGKKLLVLLQGMDTSGKDGTARGVFGRLDPLGVRCVSFKAPTAVERAHDFLWRVHREVPGSGEIVIFNRSHYEDVLVPAVHGAIDDAECQRRYRHIRDFEHMLTESGTVLLKFFLHISKDEQKKRLAARLVNPDKHWKVDMNDLAERKHWDAYQRLYQAAIAATDTDAAPWYVIPADSKTQRNLAVASIVHETLAALQLAYPPPNPAYFDVTVE